MNIYEQIQRIDEEIECLWTEIPSPGTEGRQVYLDEIDRLERMRSEAIKQIPKEDDKSDKWIQYITLGLSIFTSVVLPLSNRNLFVKLVNQAWVNEDKTILSSQTSKNYVMRNIGDLFKI